ncbi:sigma-70 family RNA polymerase sigma factor [Sphingobacterium oryzagri]|uniref:Sigma-70 family RNA polymerase sigma factor n=1 Tax=Sphingobacterium oryzagri TaxID=3025669 RepID=A0ABY7WLB6_9SPHI|nr:sigma-70 family RNA polymerase sigma factor [Sphingobacterium sp. KACC 22765]WDF69236.1 sigma-70 family RNA polymerase sigma factor [Sphingobacterium sp. KACC 22765]
MEKKQLETLWSGCLKGERKAQFGLYQLFSKKMYTVCLRYARSEDDANDILQLGFIKVFQKCTFFDNKGSLEGWIRKIMVNTAIENHRKHSLAYFESVEEKHDSIAGSLQTENNVQYKDLLSIIQTLPLGYRTIFNLYVIDGYSHREIAEQLAISESNSKSQLSRARQWLKEKLVKMEGQVL